MTFYDIPPSVCTNCGEILDAATETVNTRQKPKLGTIIVCFKCHHIMALDKNLKLRNLTDEEIKIVAGDSKLLKIMNVIDVYKKMGVKYDQ